MIDITINPFFILGMLWFAFLWRARKTDISPDDIWDEFIDLERVNGLHDEEE